MWIFKNKWAIGGLLEIGYFKDSDYLMILSSQGRGIFDCLTGEKIDRDNTNYYYDSWNPDTGIVAGFGILEGKNVICGGFEHDNVLAQKTSDNWGIMIEKEKRPDWQNKIVDTDVLYLFNSDIKEKIEIDSTPYGFDRGFGFSDSGKSFVLASSSDLLIWIRDK